MLDAAREASCLNRLVVSSDDPEVLELAASHEPRLALARPPELADDRSPAIDYVRHALRWLEDQGEGAFDIAVILQPTSPLTEAQDIDATVDLLLTSGADSAVSVMALDHAIHPVKLKTMEGDRLMPYLEPEQGRMAAWELPALFVRNCAVYATRRTVIEEGQILGDDCRGYLMPRERSIDINEILDFEFAEFLLRRRNPSSEGFGGGDS
jgi:CMP-N-acetylneuraminic acid synthetase